MQAKEVLCNGGESGNSLREGAESGMGYLDVLCNEQYPSTIDKVRIRSGMDCWSPRSIASSDRVRKYFHMFAVSAGGYS